MKLLLQASRDKMKATVITWLCLNKHCHQIDYSGSRVAVKADNFYGVAAWSFLFGGSLSTLGLRPEEKRGEQALETRMKNVTCLKTPTDRVI